MRGLLENQRAGDRRLHRTDPETRGAREQQHPGRRCPEKQCNEERCQQRGPEDHEFSADFVGQHAELGDHETRYDERDRDVPAALDERPAELLRKFGQHEREEAMVDVHHRQADEPDQERAERLAADLLPDLEETGARGHRALVAPSNAAIDVSAYIASTQR